MALYVHVPFCRAKCGYCGFYSEPIAGHDVGRLISAMLKELDTYDKLGSVRSVYIGGGSPSCLPDGQLERLVADIMARRDDAGEFTVECNPGQTGGGLLSRLRGLGVNRLSIGAQSFDQRELDFLGRGHSVESIKDAVRQGREAGFANISLDLIFAIPSSTLESWEESLRRAVELGPQHVSAYSLSYEAGTPLEKAVRSGDVKAVDEETDRAMYELAIAKLGECGFEQYEISNFAVKGRECRHNLAYWRNESYIGIGPGAASFWRGARTVNLADIDAYIEAVEAGRSAAAESEVLDAAGRACETAVLNLRMRRGIDLEEFRDRTGFDAAELFGEAIERYRGLGLVAAESGRLFLTPEALPIADSVLCDFATV